MCRSLTHRWKHDANDHHGEGLGNSLFHIRLLIDRFEGLIVVSWVVVIHARTSEITPLESAKVSVSTPIFCAMVSNRLLKCALEFTGL